MGAIGNLGPAIYAGARALQDTERMEQTDAAHRSDQAIRQETLDQSRELRPLRRRVIEGQADAQDQQQILNDLNIDVTRLKKGELETATKEAGQARTIHNHLVEGVRGFQMSGGDPSHIAEAFKKIDPDKAKDMTATRAADGSIVFTGPQGNFTIKEGEMVLQGADGTPQTRPLVSPDGKKLSPDDGVLYMLSNYYDPIKQFGERYAHAQKLAVEGEKTNRALSVAGVNATARTTAAETRAGAIGDRDAYRQSQAWQDRNLKQIKPVLDSALKTTGVAGSFISGYAHGDDAELRSIIEERTEAEVMTGTPVRQAARKVIDDVRATYDKAQKLAKERATALTKKKISPRDMAAVETAAKGGDTDAVAFLQVVKATEEALGPSISKYLTSGLPAK